MGTAKDGIVYQSTTHQNRNISEVCVAVQAPVKGLLIVLRTITVRSINFYLKIFLE